jgi:OOP family OmpA-OmpF porin
LFASTAWSQDGGFYLGGAIGQAEHEDACEGANISCDEKDSAWKIFGGYQINRNFAIELGYADLGTSKASGTVGSVTVDVQAEITVFELTAVGMLPVMDRLALFGRAGLYRSDVEVTGSGRIGTSTVPVSLSEDNVDFTFGLGVRFDITRNIGIRAEWQRYLGVGGDDTGESDIALLSLGVLFRF